jgi:hypothetical protein
MKLPKTFFDDHSERDLETPEILRVTQHHYIVDPADPALDELLEDAEHYSFGGFVEGYEYLVSSARATVKAIKQSRI